MYFQFLLMLTVLYPMKFHAVGTETKEYVQKRFFLDDAYHEMLADINELKADVAALKAHNALQVYQTVAFMAELTQTITGSFDRIIFDNVKLNTGNAYNAKYGNFTGPVNGTYQFTICACSEYGHWIVLDLWVNNVLLGKLLAGDDEYDNCNSKLFLTHLNTGDDVTVQHADSEHSGDDLVAREYYGYPTFTGLLVKAD